MTILDAIIISILFIQRFVYLCAQKGRWSLALLSSRHVLQCNIFCTFIWTWLEPNCAQWHNDVRHISCSVQNNAHSI